MTEQAPNIDLSGRGGRLVYDKQRRTIVAQPMRRPEGNNADEWTAWFFEHAGHGAGYLGVQIAEAIDEHVARTALLDCMQVVRMILLPHDENEAICIGGKFDGWQMRRHPDGQWVSVRKLAQESPKSPL